MYMITSPMSSVSTDLDVHLGIQHDNDLSQLSVRKKEKMQNGGFFGRKESTSEE